MLGSINLTSILILILSASDFYTDTKLIGFEVFMLLSIFNFLMFVRKDNYLELVNYSLKRYNYNKKQFKIIITLYYITSALLFAYSAIVEATQGNFRIINQYIKEFL